MAEEYELISYSETNFKFSMVNVLYRTPHIHKEMEVVLILNGRVRVVSRQQTITAGQGEIYVINPYQCHEILSDIPETPALALEIQLPASFFQSYYPEMGSVDFAFQKYSEHNTGHFSEIRDKLIGMASVWFGQKPFYKLLCAGQINLFYYLLLSSIPFRTLSEEERSSVNYAAGRMNRILHYIEKNHSRKLLLSEIADKEGLTLNYLSHFFKNFLGMSFQEYLLRIRCEKAQQLLMTDLSLLDISIACGFSDTKYFNRGFSRLYGCTPKQYRTDLQKSFPKDWLRFSMTKQNFLAPEESAAILERYWTKS